MLNIILPFIAGMSAYIFSIIYIEDKIYAFIIGLLLDVLVTCIFATLLR